MQIELMHKCLDAANEIIILLSVPKEEREVLPKDEVVVKTIGVQEVLAAIAKHIPHEFTEVERDVIGFAIVEVINRDRDPDCTLWELAHGLQHFFTEAHDRAQRN